MTLKETLLMIFPSATLYDRVDLVGVEKGKEDEGE